MEKHKKNQFEIFAACAAVAAGLAVLFKFLSKAVHSPKSRLHKADSAASKSAHRHKSYNKTVFFRGVTALGSAPVISFMLTVWFLHSMSTKKHRIAAFLAGCCSVCGAFTTFILKRIYRRDRPDDEHLSEAPGFSFPSGHTLSASAFYSYLTIFSLLTFKGLAGKMLALLCAVVACFVGLSRVYLGVHYISDVLGGLLAGTGWALFFTGLGHALGEEYSADELPAA